MPENNQKPQDNNLIDLARERQRLQQQRAQAAKTKKMTRTTRSSEKSQSRIQWYHYLQLGLFLLVFAYFMTLCKGS
jgi:hypothetical protein